MSARIDVSDKMSIVNDLASGKTQTQIAEEHAVSYSTVSVIKKKNKELIEKKTSELIAELPSVVDLVKKDIAQGHVISDKLSVVFEKKGLDKEESALVNAMVATKTQVNKVTEKVMQSVGIYPSQTPGFFVQNIYNDNRMQTVISSEYMKYLQHSQVSSIQDMVVDVDMESGDF